MEKLPRYVIVFHYVHVCVYARVRARVYSCVLNSLYKGGILSMFLEMAIFIGK